MTRRTLAAVVAAAAAVATMATVASAEGLAGSAGTDTSLPVTDSAITLPGRGRFSELRVTVNQTKGLANQALSVTWTGGKPSTGYSADWLQMFQCWGDDDGTNPDNPGPPPEQCEFGGEPFAGSVLSKIPSGANPSNVYSRGVASQGWSTFDTEPGDPDPDTGRKWKPFRAVDGTVIAHQLELADDNSGNPDVTTEWQNPFFAYTTTNEANWERTYGEGKGSTLFEAYTGLEAPGLGCGQAVQAQAGGAKKIPRCWLVVVPRGAPADENPSNVQQPYVVTSPMTTTAWPNRIAFPLEFNPIDSGCTIGGDQRRIVGGEIAARAVINWQPTLCAGQGAMPFAFQVIGDEQARRQVTAGATGSAGMAIVTRPIKTDNIDPENPIVYAPIALSGAVIGFNVERRPVDYEGNVKDPAEQPLAGLRVTNINLTPRLVAKLLTQSYRQQFPSLAGSELPDGYAWLGGNPEHLFRDKDFLRFNPEFDVISIGSPRSSGGVIVAGATADAAAEVWRWILADPEASKWLKGSADEWGMNVNPLYSALGDPLPDTFPKNDPYCHQAPQEGDITPRPLCMLDVSPLALSMQSAAQQTRAADDRASVAHDVHNPNQQSASTYWGTEGPQPTGSRSILSLTDAASAARDGLQTASLSRGGDNGGSRRFIAPNANGLLQGVAAMKVARDADVLVPDPLAAVADGYPLSLLTYAAVAPRSLDDAGRADYSRFVTYAAGPGQTPGLKFGDLPRGYAPLPTVLRDQSTAAAAAIKVGVPVAAGENAAEGLSGGEVAAILESAEINLDVPIEQLTLAALESVLTEELGVPPGGTASQPSLGLAAPLRALGITPEFVAGVIRFAVPVLFTIGGLALLLFMVLDTSRLRAMVLRSESREYRRD